ncbi:hypothetical protein ACXDR1_001999 [Klebsiella pneumoniae]
MTTDITELAQMKAQKVEAPYYLAECTECGKMYPSSQLIESRNYMDGDADCYCPHCNADDADIADLGSGEQPAVMAWNYQQARIDVLVEALEKAQQRIDELLPSSRNMLMPAIDGLSRNHLVATIQTAVDNYSALHTKWLEDRRRIAELESCTVTVKLPTTRLWAGVTECYEKSDVIAAIRSAGMEVSDD